MRTSPSTPPTTPPAIAPPLVDEPLLLFVVPSKFPPDVEPATTSLVIVTLPNDLQPRRTGFGKPFLDCRVGPVGWIKSILSNILLDNVCCNIDRCRRIK